MTNPESDFSIQLLKWNKLYNQREMPWKGEKDPYKIWLSEIILQQTRVEQGLGYYNCFVTNFPSIKQLAAAEETTVFKLWEGLGYYTRCKNLIATARYIAYELNGVFPKTYDSILALKGIGPYTAAAVASFAFNLPHAVVDGNVYRVLSRFFGIGTPIDTTIGKQLFNTLANELLHKKMPGIYNQALMDFGATICKPKLPLCNTCPMLIKCEAYKNNLVGTLPIKEKSISKKIRWFNYLVFEHNECIYVRKRGAKDIWENLYEFTLIESEGALPIERLRQSEIIKAVTGNQAFEINHISIIYKQQLTHQTIYGQFISVKLTRTPNFTGFKKTNTIDLLQLPFPKFITTYLKDKNVSLNLF